jgi:hypothetical protein
MLNLPNTIMPEAGRLDENGSVLIPGIGHSALWVLLVLSVSQGRMHQYDDVGYVPLKLEVFGDMGYFAACSS